jgi:hypothetical protein
VGSLHTESLFSTPAGATPPAHFLARRTAWQLLAVAVAAVVAWLVFRAYGQPGFLLDYVNLRLC